MLENVDKNVHFRYILFYECKKGNNVAPAFKNIYAAYGEYSLLGGTCRKWFIRSREGNFNLPDESSQDWSLDCNEEAIRSHLSKNARQNTSELFETLGFQSQRYITI